MKVSFPKDVLSPRTCFKLLKRGFFIPRERDMKMKITTRKMTETAVMLALATVLSLLTIAGLPFGGSVTPMSMVPILVICFRYEKAWGFLTAFLFGLIQAAISFGTVAGWGMTWQSLVGCILLDYVLAYSCLGIAGLFRKGKWNVTTGTLVAMLLRYSLHVLSGVVIFGAWMVEDIVKLVGDDIYIYSLAYNIIFMGPELLLTLLGSLFIPRILRAVNGASA